MIRSSAETRDVVNTHNADILQQNVELLCPLHQICPDPRTDYFSLRNKLGGIELRNSGFEHFVSDTGQHSFIVIQSQVLVDLGQHRNIRPGHHSQCQADHLHILAPRRGRDVPRLDSDIVQDGPL